MKLLKIFIFLISGLLIVSCNESDSNEIDLKSKESKEMVFIYNDIVYKSLYILSPDSLMVFQDKSVGDMFFYLQEKPELAMVVEENGEIVYYDNCDIVNSIYNLKEYKIEEGKNLKVSFPSITFTVYEHDNYGGKNITHQSSNNFINFTYPPGTGGKNLNDQITSFKTSASGRFTGPGLITVILWEDDNFNGKSITFVQNLNASPQYPNAAGQLNVTNLDNYIRTSGGLLHKKRTWNDCVSSFKVMLTDN
ncbi:MAG: hypothetical protein LBR46_05330 [Prevotella sp.]|jgi:hypothetical protein|nr:hypothetical protein [Prevotella sp.]